MKTLMGDWLGEDPEVHCYGHWGPGMIRAWAECPVCNPEETEDEDA
jgi:hypothetical protein